MDGVLLAWARDRDGRMVSVRSLDAASRRARAPFTCPGCGDALTPRLGAVRARHFAHRPGSACPLTAPETALHLDAKERLLALCRDAFAGARAVRLLVRCPRCRRPDPRDLAALGDAAVGEGVVRVAPTGRGGPGPSPSPGGAGPAGAGSAWAGLPGVGPAGTLRADVLVTRAGAPALAVEVRVTHAVEPGKEAALAAAGVPAVEVDARAEWEREAGEAMDEGTRAGSGAAAGSGPVGAGRGRGRAGSALAPVGIVLARAFGFPPCAACRAEARAEADRAKGGEAAAIAELESYRARGLLGRGPAPSARPGDPAPRARRARSGAGPAGRGRPGEARRNPVLERDLADPDRPLDAAERADLAARFRCPDCGSAALTAGERLLRHPCPGHGERPVAWRGYDGGLAELGWWKR